MTILILSVYTLGVFVATYLFHVGSQWSLEEATVLAFLWPAITVCLPFVLLAWLVETAWRRFWSFAKGDE